MNLKNPPKPPNESWYDQGSIEKNLPDAPVSALLDLDELLCLLKEQLLSNRCSYSEYPVLKNAVSEMFVHTISVQTKFIVDLDVMSVDFYNQYKSLLNPNGSLRKYKIKNLHILYKIVSDLLLLINFYLYNFGSGREDYLSNDDDEYYSNSDLW